MSISSLSLMGLKQAVLHLKINFVSHPANGETVGYIQQSSLQASSGSVMVQSVEICKDQ